MRSRVVVLVGAIALTAWVVGALLLTARTGEGPAAEESAATRTADSRTDRPTLAADTTPERFVRDLATLLAQSDPQAPAEALAALPGSLEPTAVRRIEADLASLATRLGGRTVRSLRGLGPDAVALGEPVELVLADGSTVRVRVVCDGPCWLAGVDP